MSDIWLWINTQTTKNIKHISQLISFELRQHLEWEPEEVPRRNSQLELVWFDLLWWKYRADADWPVWWPQHRWMKQLREVHSQQWRWDLQDLPSRFLNSDGRSRTYLSCSMGFFWMWYYLWGFRPWTPNWWHNGQFSEKWWGNCSSFLNWRLDWVETLRAAPGRAALDIAVPFHDRPAALAIDFRSCLPCTQLPVATNRSIIG